MTDPPRTILIAVDASPQSLAALETAATVAARLQAELHGMYVEDIDLLRTAQLPFARVISSLGKSYAITPEIMEQQLRRQAEKAKNAVEAAGTRSRISWSFNVVRGPVLQEIERAAHSVDLVAVGRAGWSAGTGRRVGSVTRSLVEAGATSLLMVGQDGLQQPLVVLYDGSPSSDRALTLAIALDGRGPQPITVIIFGDSLPLVQKARERLTGTTAKAQFESTSEETATVLRRLQPPSVKTLLVPATLISKIGRSPLLENSLSIFFVR